MTLLADEEFLNKTNNIALNPSVQAVAYLEHSFGGSYAINPKLMIGANIKRINGLVNIHTDYIEAELSAIPAENLLSLEGGLLGYISGDELLEEGGTEDLDKEDVRNRLKRNGGWGIDLVGTYQLTDKLQIGLSILDLGTIKWGYNAREYRINRATATFESLYGYESENSEYRSEALVDSLNKYFELREKVIGKYRTGIPIKTYLNATYQLPAALNNKLSGDRANAVAKYITSQGIPTDRLTSRGYGSAKPEADNKTEEGRSRNRRVEFTILEIKE